MSARLARHFGDAFVGKRQPVELNIENVVLVGEKIDEAMRFIDSRMAGGTGTDAAVAGDGPLAAGQLRELMTREIVEIIVAKTGAFAGPEKALVVREEVKIVGDIDPVFVSLSENVFGIASGGIAEKKVEAILGAVQALDRHATAIAQPHYTRQVDVRVGAGIHPFSFTAVDRNDAHAHDGICSARFGKARVFDRSG